ncbi:hypothetical protein BH11PAT4_BH11PAT4_4280 [soil metagenome]
MPSPESFQPVVSPELPAPTREQLRSSLIEEPFRTIQRAIEDLHEQTEATFEEKVGGLLESREDVVQFYRSQLHEGFSKLHAEVGAECELRLKNFDEKPDSIGIDQLEDWFSSVTLKAAGEREKYMAAGRLIRDNTLLALTQFKSKDV